MGSENPINFLRLLMGLGGIGDSSIEKQVRELMGLLEREVKAFGSRLEEYTSLLEEIRDTLEEVRDILEEVRHGAQRVD